MQTQLANFSFGRILLHLACACRDHKYQWHWRGILREFSRPDNLHLLGRISFMLMFSLVSLARSATPPTIPGSPTNVTVAVGSALNLAVTASGEALQYQWRKDGLDVPNATSATLTVAGSKLDDAGVYSVRVSNGSGSTNSDPAAVSVLNNVAWSDNFSVDPTLSGWQTSQWQNVGGFSWQAARRLFTISNSAPNDSALYRTVTGLLPNHNYNLHAWVKGQSIGPSGVGANICQWNSWNNSSSPTGTFDWIKLSLLLATDSSGAVDIACRLGFWGSTVSGVATFGNLALEQSLTIGNVSRPTVRVAYVIPSNRTPQTNGVSNLQKLLPLWQAWYRDQMERYGFGPKTFEFETEADGVTPKIYVVGVAETDAALRGTDGMEEYGKVSAAASSAGVPVGAPKQIWLLLPETHLMMPDGSVVGGVFLGGGGGSGDDSGTAVVDSTALARFDPSFQANDLAYDGVIWPLIGPYPLKNATTFPWFEGNTFSSISSSAQGGALHELSHAFGLSHDYRNDGNFNGNLMFNGCRGLRGNFYPARYPDDYVRLSYADALVLNTSRYFNHAANYIDNTAPDVTATTPAAQTPANGLARITFTTTDNAALAGALLHFDGSQEVVGEMLLSGTATNATFLTPYFHPGQTNVFGIAVYDTSGNRRYTNFSIFISSTTNQAPQPSVRVFPPSALVGEDVILDASRTTDPDNTSGFRVQWDLDGDGVFDTPLSTTLLFTNRFATAGLHLIRARVVDAGGAATISTPIDLRAYVPILSGSPITNHFLVSWPVWMAGFHLESNATLNSPLNWQTVGGDPVISGMSNLVDVPMVNNPQGFLRLERP